MTYVGDIIKPSQHCHHCQHWNSTNVLQRSLLKALSDIMKPSAKVTWYHIMFPYPYYLVNLHQTYDKMGPYHNQNRQGLCYSSKGPKLSTSRLVRDGLDAQTMPPTIKWHLRPQFWKFPKRKSMNRAVGFLAFSHVISKGESFVDFRIYHVWGIFVLSWKIQQLLHSSRDLA